MDKFEKLVNDCRINKSSRIIHNASIQHAGILYKHILESSKQDSAKIRIVSGNLADNFYNPLVEKFKECLDSGSHIEVVMLNPGRDLSGNKLASLLKEHNNGNLVKKKLDKSADFPHFILVGENRFRAETDHEQSKAIASFNVPGTGALLKKMFERLISPSSNN